MAKNFKLFLIAILAAVTFGTYTFICNDVARAEEGQRNAIHLQVSPTKQKISLAPGSSYVGTFKVQNVGAAEFNYSVYATPYSVINEDYSPSYEGLTNYTQIAEWITFDTKTATGKLQPGTSVDVAYTVNVPKDAPAGGQYAALMAQTEDGNDTNATVAVVHRVGMILYAAVPGDTRETGEIIKNTVNTFYFNPPLTVSSLVKNTGNIEQTATYNVKIYPLFSNEAIFSNEEKPDKEKQLDIIPETSRFNSITWEGAPRIGIFSVEQTIEFAGQVSTNKKLVLICPLWLLFVIFAMLFFIIFWLVSRARDRKRQATRSSNSEKHEEKEE
ncbi:hypothetical protein J6S35_02875 [Candidatus Saccharibacteria bacterium]|nr:hypothetical protein [Candidatus Saccharibacteria bacterium]